MTELVFRSDAYTRTLDATVMAVSDRGGIILDRTNFYASGGGQPGDIGRLEVDGGEPILIGATVYGENNAVIHVPRDPIAVISPGTPVRLVLDWDTRYRHMRVHTALHLLCSLVPYPVTGGQIAADGGRLDFDIPEAGAADKGQLTEQLNALVAADHPVTERWITDAELLDNPQLVRTMAVKPPMGSGRVRLVSIGDIDLQPCGGTHVRSTSEIGTVVVAKIEKKGRQNRRIRIAFGE
ncbi:misacylated tRNA(Ala) deacylase [Rhodoligotrophos appendicifer]|uniref:alanyl-tRNA editing protein n=1 Tax=Rhodoligotrophos appendicifer TaxID=987056 RepID=UPI00118472BF|nr:alanyl-tRNA editing protein [Rhodoligotrophos appendicifer]